MLQRLLQNTGKLLFFVTLMIFLGCARVNSINAHYARVKVEDGITRNEAKLIAKKNLIETRYKYIYQIIWPRILENNHTKRHEDLWFVDFLAKEFQLISNYLVILEKDSGKIIYADSYRGGDLVGIIAEIKKD